MARSADPRAVAPLAVLLVALALAGCDSTQRQNARAKLNAERRIASRLPLVLGRANPHVRVTDVTLLSRAGLTTIVVDLRSRASRPLTDLPIAVGVRTRQGRRTGLNRHGGLQWFQTHIASIPARGSTTWVFSERRRRPLSGRPFATVGARSSPPLSSAASLPPITAAASGGGTRAAPLVVVQNASRVPQYGLQVYALARAGGRWVAAGRATITHLGTGDRRTIAVRLSSPVPQRGLSVRAVPTIFE